MHVLTCLTNMLNLIMQFSYISLLLANNIASIFFDINQETILAVY